MKTEIKESYYDSIMRQLRKARKQGNKLAVLYYSEALNKSAVVSFETFISSWAGQEWKKKQMENS